MKTLIITTLILFSILIGHAQPPAQTTEDETPYDEWAESPTITIEGCGVFLRARILVNGRETENPGFIRGGRIFLAARETLENLGARVQWVPSERVFYAQFPDRQITTRVELGSRAVRIYQYNEAGRYGRGPLLRTARLNVAPLVCGGRTYAPVRAASEIVGATVRYEPETRTVHVQAPAEIAERIGGGEE